MIILKNFCHYCLKRMKMKRDKTASFFHCTLAVPFTSLTLPATSKLIIYLMANYVLLHTTAIHKLAIGLKMCNVCICGNASRKLLQRENRWCNCLLKILAFRLVRIKASPTRKFIWNRTKEKRELKPYTSVCAYMSLLVWLKLYSTH